MDSHCLWASKNGEKFQFTLCQGLLGGGYPEKEEDHRLVKGTLRNSRVEGGRELC